MSCQYELRTIESNTDRSFQKKKPCFWKEDKKGGVLKAAISATLSLSLEASRACVFALTIDSLASLNLRCWNRCLMSNMHCGVKGVVFDQRCDPMRDATCHELAPCCLRTIQTDILLATVLALDIRPCTQQYAQLSCPYSPGAHGTQLRLRDPGYFGSKPFDI